MVRHGHGLHCMVLVLVWPVSPALDAFIGTLNRSSPMVEKLVASLRQANVSSPRLVSAVSLENTRVMQRLTGDSRTTSFSFWYAPQSLWWETPCSGETLTGRPLRSAALWTKTGTTRSRQSRKSPRT